MNDGIKIDEPTEAEMKQSTSLIINTPDSAQSLEQAVQKASRFLELQDTMRKMAVNLTNQGDWVDQHGTPYLEWTGASKIACAFGVSYGSPSFDKEVCKDDKGEYIQFHCMAILSWNGRSLPEIGISSTRDDFFGKKNGAWIPLSEVDLTDIKKKSLTNMLNRGIKSLLGLAYTWDEIESITNKKINRNGVTRIEYSTKSKGGNTESKETKDLRVQIGEYCMEMAGGDATEAGKILEEITKWTNNEGKAMAGKTSCKDITEKALPVVYGKVKAEYGKWFNAQQQVGATA